MRALLAPCLTALAVAGCISTAGMETSDPAEKIRYAGQLLNEGRPLVAEKFIREALDIYESRGDELGVADANRAYAFFLRSSALDRYNVHYAKTGFVDKTVKFEERYGKSLEYFERSRTVYVAHERFDAVANIDLNIGLTQATIGDRAAACQAFERSLENQRENQRRHPDAKPLLPPKAATYEEYVMQQQDRVGCSNIAQAPLLVAAPGATAELALEAPWFDKVGWFPAQNHFIYLLDGTNGETVQLAALTAKSTLFADATPSSATVKLPAGVSLKLALRSHHYAYNGGTTESTCYVPFTAVFEPERRYVIRFEIKQSRATGRVTCAPRFVAIDQDGVQRELAFRRGW